MMQSISQLAALTGKTRETVAKRLRCVDWARSYPTSSG